MGCASSRPAVSAHRGEGGGLFFGPESGAVVPGPGSEAEVFSGTIRAKLVLLGHSGVGKSCLVLRFVRGQFDPDSRVTVGASFQSKTLLVGDTAAVKFEIWDTAGQERYSALAPLYYRGAAAAIIAYEITSAETFAKAKFWVTELQKHGSVGVIMALVGNKCDLEDKREVAQETAREYAGQNGMIFLETSAKTATNVMQLFEEIASQLPSRRMPQLRPID